MKIRNGRVNHIKNPIGYLMEGTPVFTWVTEEAQGKKQTEARILIAEDPDMEKIICDTGFGNLDSLGSPVQIEKKPRTRYYWTVTVRSDAGEEAVSEVYFFETGKEDEKWKGKWIGCSQETDRHPVFYKSFESSKKAVSARLYICGLGLYHAEINGKKVTEEFLTPYCTDYNQWVEYQTYDVTDLLEEKNRIEVTLGAGWYLGRFGFTSQETESCINPYYGDGRFKLIAEVVLTYEDGTEEIIGTDDSWMVSRCNITFSNIYDGERRDDTLPQASEEKAEILGEGESLPLMARLSIPVLRHEILKPVKLLHTPAGEEVFDLGQNFGGIWRLKIHEPKGTKIHIQVGEVLQNDCFYRDNLRSALAEYWYVSDGEEHVLEPQFTFYGYRYAKVEGVSDLTIDSFEGIAVYSDITPAGQWECGKPKLNRLMENIKWGQKSNFIDVPTDCPQRDERMGWTADTQVFVPTASYLTDSWAFYRKFLKDLELDQCEHEGMIPAVVPAFGVDMCCAVWGDAATFIPWYLYKFHGDVSILERQFDSMKSWVDYIEEFDGQDRLWEKKFFYGDWLALDSPKEGKEQIIGGTEEGYISYVYYMASAEIVAKSAEILGKEDIAEEYREKYQKIREHILNEYFTPSGRCAINTMTGHILALHFNLTANRELTVNKLKELLHDAGEKFKTGFVGTPLLAGALSSMGEDKMAYTVLHNEEYPGWLYEINLGATTIWERWNSMEPDGTVSSTGMNSFNHYAYGTIGQWMWETMAGIAADEEKPGFRHAVLRPVPDYRTGWVKAAYDSAAGRYETSWKVLDSTHVNVKVTVPFNCTATLILPFAADEEVKRELTAGTYEITYTLTKSLCGGFSVDSTINEIMECPEAKEELLKIQPGFAMYPARMFNQTVRENLELFSNGADESVLAPIMEQINKAQFS